MIVWIYGSILAILAGVGLILPLVKGERAWKASLCTLIAILALSLGLLYLTLEAGAIYAFEGAVRIDPYGSLFSLIACSSCIIALLSSRPRVAWWGTASSFYSLALLALLGVYVVAFVNDLITALASWVLSSVASYAIVSLAKDRPSSEGGVKYALMGSTSSIMLFFGAFALFVSLGTTTLSDRSGASGLTHSLGPYTMLVISIFLLAAIGFKMGVFPFQAWLPDTYGGVHPSLISYVVAMAKALALLMIIRLIAPLASQYPETWFYTVAIFSVFTMTFGNIAALLQESAQRMIAYSSIAHTGYLLVGLAGLSLLPGIDTGWAMMGLLIHYSAYSLAKVGVFTGLSEIRNGIGGVTLGEMRGLGKRMPVTAATMTLLLLSLIGVPPLLGFWGKLYLFASVVERAPALVLAALINSGISVAYYMRIMRALYFDEPKDYGRIEESREGRLSMILTSILTVGLGLGVLPFIASLVVG